MEPAFFFFSGQHTEETTWWRTTTNRLGGLVHPGYKCYNPGDFLMGFLWGQCRPLKTLG